MTELNLKAPTAYQGDRVNRLPLHQGSNDTMSVPEWDERRAQIASDWRAYLGTAPYAPLPLESVTVREDDLGYCTGTEIHLKTEPDYFEQCYLMVPKMRRPGKLPAVVVFFYDIDTPSGHYMGSQRWNSEHETRRFAKHLVQRGYVALVQRWVHEGYASATGKTGSLQQRYSAGVAILQQKYPGWKGLGRVVWDATRCVDYLQTLDFVDQERIGCMGHSLGGKMSLYAGAFDSRIRVVVSSEPGIGMAFSNYDAPWYLGPEVQQPDFPRDNHQLLALIAPRPFLLIAGESADGDRSWAYLNSAREIYSLYGQPNRIGMVNHRSGHTPTTQSLELAYQWFDQWL